MGDDVSKELLPKLQPLYTDGYRVLETLDPNKPEERCLYSEPGHVLGFAIDFDMLKWPLTAALGLSEDAEFHVPERLRELTFMLVEDSIIHGKVGYVLTDKGGFTAYKTQEDVTSRDAREQERENHGVYSSAERALEVMYGGATPKPADIILSDIELLGAMKGTKFVREVYNKEKAAGRKPVILMLYSSNPGPYLDEIERLKQEGIIIGGWHKKDFTPKVLIETVEKAMSEKD
ncbi:MAG: hypothetical protein FJY77_00040 [Candidatus Altiarchaeales archaeon]|nr:hypothetical protein [Candidatus Altiarchaeales archaeon]